MKRIHKSGIYESSSGASINYYRRLTELNRDGYTEETIARMCDDYFEVEGKETDSEGFFDYADKIESVELAESIDYTEEAVDRQLLGELTAEETALVKQIPGEDMIKKEPDYQERRQALELYSAALLEEEIIYVTRVNFPGEDNAERVYFSIVDMDGDETDELVFTCEYDVIEILHYEDGKVYSYQMRPLKFDTAVIATDGVFRVEDDISPTGYARIVSFEEDGYKTEPVEDYEAESHERIRYYFYSEEAIAEWLE